MRRLLISLRLSNLYQPRCTARCADFIQTQRLLGWLSSHYDEVASELNIGKDCRSVPSVSTSARREESHMRKRRFPYEE
jgi:hypothetical protein